MSPARTLGPGLAPAAALALALGLLGGSAGASVHAMAARDSNLSAQAKQALLVRSDLPKGWTAPKGSGNNNDLPPSPQLAQCAGIALSLLNENPPQVNSPNFTSKDQTLEVDDIVSEFASVADAKAQFAAMANPKTPGCLNQVAASDRSLFLGAVPKGTTVGAVTVTSGPAITGTASFVVHVPISTQGVSLTVTQAEVVFVHGRLGQQLTFYGYGPSFPVSLERHLVTVAQHRL
jgi:hypothetical protein